jgi:thioredoxin 1
MTKPTLVTDENFKKEVLQHKEPVMAEFFAVWCPHCQRMKPIIEELAKEYAGKVKICAVDVERSAKASSDFGIEGTPTMFFFKNQKREQKLIGEQSIQNLRDALDALI